MAAVNPEWVEAGADKLAIRTGYPLSTARAVVEAVLDAVEPLIRADEQRHVEMAAVIDRQVVEDDIRGQIAAEIEDACNDQMTGTCPRCARAARIARGES